jgi:hypothetical protein
LEGAGCAAAGLAGALGALGAAAAGAAAFFTDRIALGAGAGAAGAVGLAPAWIRLRMREASSSLIELLWLFAAMASFSAASSTSLLSRPKSRDSS